jgi:hypothetical protein
MWDIIISLIYHQSCRSSLAAVRKHRLECRGGRMMLAA